MRPPSFIVAVLISIPCTVFAQSITPSHDISSSLSNNPWVQILGQGFGIAFVMSLFEYFRFKREGSKKINGNGNGNGNGNSNNIMINGNQQVLAKLEDIKKLMEQLSGYDRETLNEIKNHHKAWREWTEHVQQMFDISIRSMTHVESLTNRIDVQSASNGQLLQTLARKDK